MHRILKQKLLDYIQANPNTLIGKLYNKRLTYNKQSKKIDFDGEYLNGDTLEYILETFNYVIHSIKKFEEITGEELLCFLRQSKKIDSYNGIVAEQKLLRSHNPLDYLTENQDKIYNAALTAIKVNQNKYIDYIEMVQVFKLCKLSSSPENCKDFARVMAAMKFDSKRTRISGKRKSIWVKRKEEFKGF